MQSKPHHKCHEVINEDDLTLLSTTEYFEAQMGYPKKRKSFNDNPVLKSSSSSSS